MRRYRWRSVAFQEFKYPNAKWAPAIRAIITSTADVSASRACVESCCWNLSLTEITNIGHKMGYDLSAETNAVRAAFSLAKRIVGLSDKSCTDMVAHRLVDTPAQSNGTMAELLNIDEASSCLLKDEQENLAGEQEREKATQRRNLEHHEEFRELVRSVTVDASASRKRLKADKIKVPENMDVLEQAAVKMLFPLSICVEIAQRRDLARAN